jgi:hypothetical protein
MNDKKTLYTLIMHDPDAPSGNFIHWIKINMNGNEETVVEYMPPSPPKGQTHRYIFLLIKQEREINNQLFVERTTSLKDVYSMLGLGLNGFAVATIQFKNIATSVSGGTKKQRWRTQRRRTQRRRSNSYKTAQKGNIK